MENFTLIDGYKFDMRVYILITNLDPFTAYLYDDGIVRLASEKYQFATKDNYEDLKMHLTNAAINTKDTHGKAQSIDSEFKFNKISLDQALEYMV